MSGYFPSSGTSLEYVIGTTEGLNAGATLDREIDVLTTISASTGFLDD